MEKPYLFCSIYPKINGLVRNLYTKVTKIREKMGRTTVDFAGKVWYGYRRKFVLKARPDAEGGGLFSLYSGGIPAAE